MLQVATYCTSACGGCNSVAFWLVASRAFFGCLSFRLLAFGYLYFVATIATVVALCIALHCIAFVVSCVACTSYACVLFLFRFYLYTVGAVSIMPHVCLCMCALWQGNVWGCLRVGRLKVLKVYCLLNISLLFMCTFSENRFERNNEKLMTLYWEIIKVLLWFWVCRKLYRFV